MTFLIFLFVHAASSIKGKIWLLQWFAKERYILYVTYNMYSRISGIVGISKKRKISLGNGHYCKPIEALYDVQNLFFEG